MVTREWTQNIRIEHSLGSLARVKNQSKANEAVVDPSRVTRHDQRRPCRASGS